MTSVTIPESSFLMFAEAIDYQDEGITFFDTPDLPDFIPDVTDTMVEIDTRYLGRLDLLSSDQYGTTDYWWVIAHVNGIREIPSELSIGMKVRVPMIARVRDFVSKARQ
jgi:hypothetical protein